jgi:hypothetical protein
VIFPKINTIFFLSIFHGFSPWQIILDLTIPSNRETSVFILRIIWWISGCEGIFYVI